jgi:single-strand DNA-binding protein
MNNLNSILIEGYLTKEPVYTTTAKDGPVCTFTIGSNWFFKKDSEIEKEESFFTIKTSGKLAENCANLGHEGRGVRVVGRLKQERWNDADGKPHSKIFIIAEHIEWRPVHAKGGKYEG